MPSGIARIAWSSPNHSRQAQRTRDDHAMGRGRAADRDHRHHPLRIEVCRLSGGQLLSDQYAACGGGVSGARSRIKPVGVPDGNP